MPVALSLIFLISSVVVGIYFSSHPTFLPSHATSSIGEVWLSPRSDGQVGDGSQANPFNASTQTRLDAVIAVLGKHPIIIHFLPGTYFTNGIPMYSGWQIVGSGIDVTTINYAGGGRADYGIISGWRIGDDKAINMSVSNLTVDAKGVDGSNDVRAGVVLRGSDNNIIDSVRVTNPSAPSRETFIITSFALTV